MSQYDTQPCEQEQEHKPYTSNLSCASALVAIKWLHQYKQAHNGYLAEIARMPRTYKWAAINVKFFLLCEVPQFFYDTLAIFDTNGRV